MEKLHDTATKCHLPYGITQCYTFYPTQANTPRLHPSQTGWYSICRPFKGGGLYKCMNLTACSDCTVCTLGYAHCWCCRSSSHKYEGEFINGRFDGVGVFTRSDGMKYEGEFKDGNITGYGQNELLHLPPLITIYCFVSLLCVFCFII